MAVTKKMNITNAATGQVVDSRDIGAEAQYIEVSRDANGEIISDITAEGVVVESTERLTDTLKNMQNSLIFDEVPTPGSDNPVRSKGLVPESTLSPTSSNPVQNQVITQALNTKLSTNVANPNAWDETPTANSTKPVISGGIKTALDNHYVTAGQKNGSTLGNNSTIEGIDNIAEGTGCHAEGTKTIANGNYSHAEGYYTSALSLYSHAEGGNTIANNQAAHAEGQYTSALGIYSHAEGYWTLAEEPHSHAEGYQTIAKGNANHAEGYQTSAIGTFSNGFSHSEGEQTYAQYRSHAEGQKTTANGTVCHSEGKETLAGYQYSHAEGLATSAIGGCSHTSGQNTIANYCQTVVGSYNVSQGTHNNYTSNSGYFIVGSGSSSAKANCFRATETNTYGKSYAASGADYAEMFEWLDSNQDNEDRAGKFVTLDGDKIKLATSNDDYILGVISGNPSVMGNTYDDQWQGMFETDIYGRPIYEKQERELEDGTKVYDDVLKISEKYDSTKEYIPRSERPEWDAVGLLGKLICLDDGTAEVNDYITVNNDSIATKANEKTKYRVMKRVDENHIQIMIL